MQLFGSENLFQNTICLFVTLLSSTLTNCSLPGTVLNTRNFSSVLHLVDFMYIRCTHAKNSHAQTVKY
jgi:hypothetical protein